MMTPQEVQQSALLKLLGGIANIYKTPQERMQEQLGQNAQLMGEAERMAQLQNSTVGEFNPTVVPPALPAVPSMAAPSLVPTNQFGLFQPTNPLSYFPIDAQVQELAAQLQRQGEVNNATTPGPVSTPANPTDSSTSAPSVAPKTGGSSQQSGRLQVPQGLTPWASIQEAILSRPFSAGVPRTLGMTPKEVNAEWDKVGSALDKQLSLFLQSGDKADAQKQQLFKDALALRGQNLQERREARMEEMQLAQLQLSKAQDQRSEDAAKRAIEMHGRELGLIDQKIESEKANANRLNALAEKARTQAEMEKPPTALQLGTRDSALTILAPELSASDLEALRSSNSYARGLDAYMRDKRLNPATAMSDPAKIQAIREYTQQTLQNMRGQALAPTQMLSQDMQEDSDFQSLMTEYMRQQLLNGGTL